MKKCQRCGEKNHEQDRYCRNCGAKLDVRPAAKLIENFKDRNIISRIIIVLVLFFIVACVFASVYTLIFGPVPSSYSEEMDTIHPSEFRDLDYDGDGYLAYDELIYYTPGINSSHSHDIFNDADRNSNGFLKGGEFDAYLLKLKSAYDDIEKKEKTEKEKEDKSTSSHSIPSVENNGKCPSCGSDEELMYEYYDEFGRPYYQCSVCDYLTYDEGEFYD